MKANKHMTYKGHILYEPNTGGKAGYGKNKTGSIQVRKPLGGGYLAEKNFSFKLDDPLGRLKAIEKAKQFIDLI